MPVASTPKSLRTNRPFALLCSTALAGAAVLMLSASPVQAQSLPRAKGGAGGAGTSAGGTGGDAGQAGQDGEGAGGGAGGAAGASPGEDGGNGELGTDTSGGGGGGGGAHGGTLVGDPVGNMTGGNGGSGGSVVFGGRTGGGGGGGAGGDGAVYDGDPAATISINPGITLAGGAGGAGGGPVGGGGGVGGAGLTFSGGTVMNAGTLRGGRGSGAPGSAGGAGGNGLNFSGTRVENRGMIHGGAGGGLTIGSDGGVGLFFVGEAVDNFGEIRGGDGGDGFDGSGNGGTGFVFAGRTATNAGTIRGGNGGLVRLGDDGVGGGGVGLSFTDETVINRGNINGGDGGAIDSLSSSHGVRAGVGGNGVTMGAGMLVNSAAITGGNGGSKLPDPTPAGDEIMDGGQGGIGVSGAGSRIFNTGSITGGSGGIGGDGIGSRNGKGGTGIAGSDLVIVNSGTIAGGVGGDGGGQAAAIVFTGGTNRLELQAGWAIVGGVDASAGTNDRLELGGAADSRFDVGQISAGQFRGFEHFEKTGTGIWTLTGTGAQDWSIASGTLKGDADSLGGDLSFGTGGGVRGVIFDQSADGSGDGTILGNGRIIKTGAGMLTLTGDSSGFSGATMVDGGRLSVNGLLGGTVTVNDGGTLGGSGTVGATVVADGGRLAPGSSVGNLTIDGDLTLSAGAFLDYELGSPGGSAGAPGTSDRIDVVGDLTLDGTLNLAQGSAVADGTAGLGYYRIMTYGGSLIDNGLAIGAAPPLADPALYRIDAGGGNVDLFVGAAGDDRLQHWQGGDGVWNAANEKWLNQGSEILVAWAGHHAVFKNTPGGFDGGTIAVEGVQSFEGLQFVDSGYRLAGAGELRIDGSERADGNAEIRVLAGETAGIATVITGTGGLTKTEGGTLVLQGNNSYQGGTAINGGTVSVSADVNLGDVAGGIALDGGALQNTAAFATGRTILLGASGGILQTDSALTVSGVISGGGALTKAGAGMLTLTNANGYTGGTTVSAGGLNAAVTGALGSGPVNVTGGGRLRFTNNASAESLDIALVSAGMDFDDNASAGTATIVNSQSSINFGGTASAGSAQIINNGGGTSFNGRSSAGNARIIAGREGTVDFYQNATAGDATIMTTAVTGPNKSVVRFHGNSDAGNATFVNAAGGQVDISDLTASGVAIGSLSGDGAVYLGSKSLTLGGLGKDDVIGGVIQDGGDVGGGGGTGGSLVKTGTGRLTLNGANIYTGLTTVLGGTLIVGGAGHSGAALTGDVAVGVDATLGGIGTIGGDVTVAGRISSGNSPGTLTIGGDLSLADSALLDFEFGEANVPGGALNDLVNVGGNLVLDGTIDVTVPTGGAFDIGVYRVFNYGGTLTDRGLDFGTLPADSNVVLQTSIAGQVNLVNAGIVRLSFWDGAAGPKNDGAVNGGDGVWQASPGNDYWTDASGAVNAAYLDGAFAIFGGAAGTVTVDDAPGAVSVAGMQFAADGYVIAGDGIMLNEAQTVVRVGDGSVDGAGFRATIDAALGGAAQLVKTDAGTLILGGANGYAGGTLINGGTVQIARDANLGAAAGRVTLDGGTLATSADMTSEREISVAGPGTIATAADTRFTFGGRFTGAGMLTKAGAGTLLVTGNNDGFEGSTTVAAGTLAVRGILGGTVTVGSGGRLEGGGRVGSLVNAGTVSPGSGPGVLTVTGDYEGRGGVLEIETGPGGDGVPVSDLLVVGGATAGNTLVRVTDRSGLSAPTEDGIKIVDVAGASNGSFALDGDYMFDGQQTVIAGAYGYRLAKNGIATPQDGDWYLRSSAPGNSGPLYQPGVPVYEAYIGALQALNGLPTLQQRVGNRSWAGTPMAGGKGIWGRFESQRLRPGAAVSTSGTDRKIDGWQAQMGADVMLAERGDGATLVGGISGHYGTVDAAVTSIFGNGLIDTKGYGIGASLTWYGPQGFYVDGQAKLSWFDSDLKSNLLGVLVEGNKGKGRAFSLELGKRSSVGGGLTVTPQVQMTYTHVGFDRFADQVDTIVSADRGDSLRTRWGLSLDHRQSRGATGEGRSTHVYAMANIAYEWLEGARAGVSGTPVENRDRRLTGELGLGGSYSWGGGRFTLYSEVAGDTALAGFGDGYSIKGTAGLRMQF